MFIALMIGAGGIKGAAECARAFLRGEHIIGAELEAWAIKIINTNKGIKLQKYVNSEMRMLLEELKAKGF